MLVKFLKVGAGLLRLFAVPRDSFTHHVAFEAYKRSLADARVDEKVDTAPIGGRLSSFFGALIFLCHKWKDSAVHVHNIVSTLFI